jgi:hypothetical protein
MGNQNKTPGPTQATFTKTIPNIFDMDLQISY